jgi:hypothetical protein
MKQRFRSVTLSYVLGACAIFVASSAHASLEVRFQTAGQIESGDAFANVPLGVVQSPFQVANWNDGSGNQSTSFSVGDGHHGVFDVSTYSIYDSDPATSSVIEIDTDVYPNLQFTEFRLRTGWTIRPLGSRPLTLRIQSTFRVDAGASIDCSGETGAANGPPGSTVSGGRGRCGGGSGGRGGSITLPAESGVAVGSLPATAGGPGLASAHGGGGGSGLSDAVDNAVAGAAGSGTGGVAGLTASPPDRGFSLLEGGAGGGGGSALTGDSSGAGGGAGGGGVFVYVGTDTTLAGLINANGGSGGGSLTSAAGPGGGGAGGSIVLFSGGTISLTGALTAESGQGGTTSYTPATPSAGRGALGRIWPVDKNGMVTTNANDAWATLSPFGTVAGISSSTAVSRLIDLEATRPIFTSIASDDDGSVGLEVATAATPFTIAEADWKPATSLLELSGKRYARFRLTLSAVTKVRSVIFVYTAVPRENFDFGSCQRVSSGGGAGGPGGALLFLLVLLLPVLLAQKLRRN